MAERPHCFCDLKRKGKELYLQCDAPYVAIKQTKFLQIVRQSGCVNLIDSHAPLQSSHSCKLNIVAWVVELTYLYVIVTCESLLSKALINLRK